MNRILICMTMVAVMAACKQSGAQKAQVGVVSPEVFSEKIGEFTESGTSFRILDIRTAEELEATGFIDGAEHMDWYADEFRSKAEAMDREVPVFVYCRSGGRSGDARNLFGELGFKQVYDLEGGILNWLSSENPVVH